MTTFISRRAFGAGLAGLAVAGTAHAEICAVPVWAMQLRTDLETMARRLTATLRPWAGPKRVLTPEQFGYRPGAALATAAIQAAIDAAAAKGGGTVRLSHGDYVSGTVELRDHVRLDIAGDARLVASLDINDYPERVARRPTVQDSNMGMNQSLIHAEGCRNIALTGKGMIYGRGYKTNFSGPETSGQTPGRPFLIRIIDCTQIHVAGLHMKDSPCWMQNYLNCEDLLMEDLVIENQANFNNDGIDIDGCRRAIVRRCWVNSEDDAMCFKGASQRPGEDILVENCRFYSQTNGVKFGTDSEGDFRNVLVRDCEVGGPTALMNAARHRRTDGGIAWECVDGATVENLMATRIHIVRAKSPLFLRLGDRARKRPEQPRPGVGVLRRIVFDHITGEDNGPRGAFFTGLPGHPIEDVVVSDVSWTIDPTQAAPVDQAAIEEMPDKYPDAMMIPADAPAYGLWARHMRNLTLVRFMVTPAASDPRPAVLADMDVTGLCGA